MEVPESVAVDAVVSFATDAGAVGARLEAAVELIGKGCATRTTLLNPGELKPSAWRFKLVSDELLSVGDNPVLLLKIVLVKEVLQSTLYDRSHDLDMNLIMSRNAYFATCHPLRMIPPLIGPRGFLPNNSSMNMSRVSFHMSSSIASSV